MIALDRHDVQLNDFGVSWPHWVRDHGPVDRIAVIAGPEVHGWPTARQIGGYVSTPADTVLGLKPWDDAREGVVLGAPWVIYDIEKLVRMLLRQSPHAFRIVASHVCAHEILSADRRFLLESAVAAQLVRNIAAESATPPSLRKDTQLNTLAELTAGWALARGHADLHAATVLGAHPQWAQLDLTNPNDVARAIEALRHELQTCDVALPEQPSNYDGLSRWLVDRRQQAAS